MRGGYYLSQEKEKDGAMPQSNSASCLLRAGLPPFRFEILRLWLRMTNTCSLGQFLSTKFEVRSSKYFLLCTWYLVLGTQSLVAYATKLCKSIFTPGPMVELMVSFWINAPLPAPLGLALLIASTNALMFDKILSSAKLALATPT